MEFTTEITSNENKGMKKKSDVWNFFKLVEQDKMTCNICGKFYSVKGGASNLRRHLMKKHKKIFKTVLSVDPSTYDNSVVHLVIEDDGDEEEKDEEDEIEQALRTLTDDTEETETTTFYPQVTATSVQSQDHWYTSKPSPICIVSPPSKHKKIDLFEAISVNMAGKLRRMDQTQQVLAEGLISKIIKKGLFSELTRNTDIGEEKSQLLMLVDKGTSVDNDSLP